MPRVRSPEERSKAKEVENYQYTSVPMRARFETVFRTIISVNQLSIYTEQSQIGVRNTNPPMLEQGDPCQ